MQPQATQTPPATEQKAAEAPADKMPAGPTKAPAKSGYGKRPMWQWVLIYVVLAIIVYGVIYYVWIRKSGTGTGSTGGY